MSRFFFVVYLFECEEKICMWKNGWGEFGFDLEWVFGGKKGLFKVYFVLGRLKCFIECKVDIFLILIRMEFIVSCV